jgi:hypothetical protein
MKAKKKKKVKSMEELTSGYSDFIKDKELNPNGLELLVQ